MYLLMILFILINSIKSCPLTDNYLSRCHCGILTNGDSYIKCDEYSLDHIPIFKRSFPYDELILSNNNIKNLTSTSFDNIKTIKRINLENNSLSFIDDDLLRLLGNYLEELILTGDEHINSLEFLTRYPLKKLRLLKLNRFNLIKLDFEKIFFNMTKLEIVSLRSCQLKQIPNIKNLQILDLENNQISNDIYLYQSYLILNLAKNFISSINIEKNLKLISLNLSSNSLRKLNFSKLNENLEDLNLNFNHLVTINLNQIPLKLKILSINNNLIKQIQFSNKSSSLLSLDLSYNQLKTIEKNILFENLSHLNLQGNPLECNCHLEWLKNLNLFNKSTWTCYLNQTFLSSNFQCLQIPRLIFFNISYIKFSSENGLFIQWLIIDENHYLNYIQISLSKPFYLSPKISSNQTEIFLTNSIELNQKYHICIILLHKYARDKYCREFLTNQLLTNSFKEKRNSLQINEQFNMNLYLILIGTCLGGLITCLLIFTCCYLCYRIHKYNIKKKTNHNHSFYSSQQQNLHYPIYHSSTCPYHHENLSNSTNSSQFDTSLSTTNFKHIYQTIDSQHYSSLKRDNQLFHLWNQSLKQKR